MSKKSFKYYDYEVLMGGISYDYYDYEVHCRVKAGVVLPCEHPYGMNCRCNARRYAGRTIAWAREREIKRGEVKVKAAKLRVLAANQRTMAAGYRRQAAHPIYPGQDLICLSKADEIAALAARSEAEADLLDAS